MCAGIKSREERSAPKLCDCKNVRRGDHVIVEPNPLVAVASEQDAFPAQPIERILTMANTSNNTGNNQQGKGGKGASDNNGGKSTAGKDQRGGSDKSTSSRTSKDND
jgi:hypothetical protein